MRSQREALGAPESHVPSLHRMVALAGGTSFCAAATGTDSDARAAAAAALGSGLVRVMGCTAGGGATTGVGGGALVGGIGAGA